MTNPCLPWKKTPANTNSGSGKTPILSLPGNSVKPGNTKKQFTNLLNLPISALLSGWKGENNDKLLDIIIR
jgi:hypothetical protein